jgi:hypothetical protein
MHMCSLHTLMLSVHTLTLSVRHQDKAAHVHAHESLSRGGSKLRVFIPAFDINDRKVYLDVIITPTEAIPG